MNTNKPIPNPPPKMKGLRELYQKAAFDVISDERGRDFADAIARTSARSGG